MKLVLKNSSAVSSRVNSSFEGSFISTPVKRKRPLACRVFPPGTFLCRIFMYFFKLRTPTYAKTVKMISGRPKQ